MTDATEDLDLATRTPTAALAEVTHVRETAERIANGGTTEGADQIRVLAGLIQQLAVQTEKLWVAVSPSPLSDQGVFDDPA